MSLILDTDHCVAILRGRLRWEDHITSHTLLYITTITVGELVFGAYISRRRLENLALMDRFIRLPTILSFDEAAARQFGQLKDILRRTGTPLADLDLQIASIALSHGLPLVTHNTAHFDRVPGLVLADWLAS